MLSSLKFVRSARLRNISGGFYILLIFFFASYAEVFAQQNDIVDFLKVEATVVPNADTNSITGTVKYFFKPLQKTDSIYLDAKNMKVLDYEINGVQVKIDEDKIWLLSKFEKNVTYSIIFTYEAIPKQTLYFFGNEIWTQGQGKYTSHWLPSIDDTNDKIEFDLTIVAPEKYTVISNGKLKKTELINDQKYWYFDMGEPMSSYLVAFAIGDFDKKMLSSSSGIPLELYYKPSDSLKFEPTYRYSKRIFDFLEEEIGIAFPWQIYKQVPLRDFLYAGMENTTATFFSEAFVVDSIGFNDRNYINVNAHELAHQWFGDMVTAKTDSDHWLQEGFATYYALLSEKEIFGDDYYYWQLYQTAEQLKASSDEGKGESLLNPKASSLTFYQKGAWALHVLREKIGDESFKDAIKNYLKKYRYGIVTTSNFLDEVKAVSNVDITQFEENWLHQGAFQSEDAYRSLMKSIFIQNYFEISALRTVPLKDKKAQLRSALTFPNDFIGQEVIYQLAEEPISETLPIYKKALESNNLYVRQAVALSLRPIPRELQNDYESLLKDNSYVTLESALYQIWVQFPAKRMEYLDQTEGIEGFQNKNIRQLWLALALITENYRDSNKVDYLMELKQYTSTEYSFEVRDKAFEYVSELKLWDSGTLENLIDACVHPTWRFAKSSRELLKSVLENGKWAEIVKALQGEMSGKAANYLTTILKE
ncbi:M1 family peptidase [Aequorivita sp. H23M31]|uniref:Aminopeptidase N n=2 Tax=Aequorivita ciconiae TaxID=2494375 RepID=A0A410G793_9FLAO|nr:M1 family peptidase [Aequorivita sp. H23M31]